MCETLNRNARFASIKTTTGETAEAVSERLARLINEGAPFGWGKGRNLVSASGGKIDGLLGTRHDYIIAGTEVGLGIPKPPTSLSCNLDSESKTITLRWKDGSKTIELPAKKLQEYYAARYGITKVVLRNRVMEIFDNEDLKKSYELQLFEYHKKNNLKRERLEDE